MLSDVERAILNTALEKYRPGHSEPILVGGKKVLKPALRLMTWCRLVIDEVKDSEVVTSYRRWVDTVQVKGTDNKEVYKPSSISVVQLMMKFSARPGGQAEGPRRRRSETGSSR
jgi:hypothetical protein